MRWTSPQCSPAWPLGSPATAKPPYLLNGKNRAKLADLLLPAVKFM
jgi:hypothetical protein